MDTGIVLYIAAGAAAGFGMAWFISRALSAKETGALAERAAGLEKQLADSRQEAGKTRLEADQNRDRAARAETENKALLEKVEDQKAEFGQLQQKMTAEFENLANRLLDEKARKFTEQNRENIGNILGPLQERIKDFQKRVEDAYDKESKERVSLEREIKRLAELNVQISKDATDLTKALKGEAKTQGNWGEMILEKILERSGLRKDQEFKVQETRSDEEGGRLRPDVVVYLPDSKNIVLDSKVSLTAYERFSSEDGAEKREKHLADHVASVRSHIKNLKQKNYQKLYGINAPDFVLMFMPLEAAFAAAMSGDDGLFAEAFDQGIVIVSPTTLLTTLRTIANIWRQERQNRNVIEIANHAGDLYDKFVGFVEDLKKVGGQIAATQNTYNEAMNKLTNGKGNLVRRAQRIRQLGANTSKVLPNDLVEKSMLDAGDPETVALEQTDSSTNPI